ncbi:hypothetical protein LCGC14_1391850 [marine sediment metagenome]|uniref:Uncharacterized protein n=1 Tax=marine sediment metagenome TaxID=412755 RepID=A0A0F9N1C8_9ZZZZ
MTDKELVGLHKLILKICQDKYSVPEMMADRITKEVDRYLEEAIPIIAEEIKRELEKLVIHEDADGKVELLDVVMGKDWQAFWSRYRSYIENG